MNRRLAGQGSGSRRGKNPTKLTKIRDKKKKDDKGSPTQFTNEKAVQEILAQLQLEEQNATTPKPKPEQKKTSIADRLGRTFQFKDPCRVCNVFGHWNDLCPYLKFVPDNITKVGKGYEILEGRYGRYASPIYCHYCRVPCDHESDNCSHE